MYCLCVNWQHFCCLSTLCRFVHNCMGPITKAGFFLWADNWTEAIFKPISNTTAIPGVLLWKVSFRAAPATLIRLYFYQSNTWNYMYRGLIILWLGFTLNAFKFMKAALELQLIYHLACLGENIIGIGRMCTGKDATVFGTCTCIWHNLS